VPLYLNPPTVVSARRVCRPPELAHKGQVIEHHVHRTLTLLDRLLLGHKVGLRRVKRVPEIDGELSDSACVHCVPRPIGDPLETPQRCYHRKPEKFGAETFHFILAG
jgi:hypothetical protein